MTFEEYTATVKAVGLRRAWERFLVVYQDLYFRYLQACRDYPYFEHEKPAVFESPTRFGYPCEDIERVAKECEREFARTI
jgi:hypothetical protein